ncbi:hypothetical protein AZE42_08750 [Rhizopogon vesiculosus]|uniref:Uncharacterized protein n=1 Tax=Rhizopogon vesiculosus TaxID=180088 RepID=A0A1J8PG41_9AGAM|nr:hypothetical protein AZE42_08750 [Rhizopogon vesiculosus]
MSIYHLNRFSTALAVPRGLSGESSNYGRRVVMLPSHLLRLVHHRPDWFLDEMIDLLDDNRLVAVHFSTIHRELVRAGISRKWLKKIARE